MKSIVINASGERCEKWLLERLADGPVNSKIIRNEATALGFSEGTLFRAAQRIPVQSERLQGPIRKTVWSVKND